VTILEPHTANSLLACPSQISFVSEYSLRRDPSRCLVTLGFGPRTSVTASIAAAARRWNGIQHQAAAAFFASQLR
jgi:hypothetical protein